jgi:hypothetical protein
MPESGTIERFAETNVARAGQTGALGSTCPQIICKYFIMNALQNNEPSSGSGSVKLSQSESNQCKTKNVEKSQLLF